jgi:hypothetical protein
MPFPQGTAGGFGSTREFWADDHTLTLADDAGPKLAIYGLIAVLALWTWWRARSRPIDR